MKKLFFACLFLVLGFNITKARTPTYLGVKIGPSFNKFPSGYKYSPGYIILLNGNFKLSKRSAISAGLGFNSFSDHYSSYADTLLNPYPGLNSVCSCNYGEGDVTFNQILSPVKYSYSLIINSKRWFYIAAGLELSLVTKYSSTSTAYRIDSNGNIEYSHPSTTSDNQSDFNDKINNRFRRILGIGYSQHLNKVLVFSIESNYSHSKDLNVLQILLGIGMKI